MFTLMIKRTLYNGVSFQVLQVEYITYKTVPVVYAAIKQTTSTCFNCLRYNIYIYIYICCAFVGSVQYV